jgi:hypothetical protein
LKAFTAQQAESTRRARHQPTSTRWPKPTVDDLVEFLDLSLDEAESHP